LDAPEAEGLLPSLSPLLQFAAVVPAGQFAWPPCFVDVGSPGVLICAIAPVALSRAIAIVVENIVFMDSSVYQPLVNVLRTSAFPNFHFYSRS
jgi:hypothetical protein